MTERRRNENLMQLDPHDAPMPIDYFVWVVRNENRTVVVDTGFGEAEGRRRGRETLRTPVEALATVGVDAGAVETVVMTHMHYDHAGNIPAFPHATFHIQQAEMRFVTGPHMRHRFLRHSFTCDEVCTMVRAVYDERVTFHDGAGEIAPGIEVHLVGGHTLGLQFVRVLTHRGWVVLAVDAAHFYENMEAGLPFPVVLDIGSMLAGHAKLLSLADSPGHVVPGHDPLVMERYPAPGDRLRDIAVRLDVAPTG